MGTYIYAKLIEAEPFINRVREAGQYSQSGPEQDAFFEAEINPVDDEIRLSSTGNAYEFTDVCNEIRTCLPEQFLTNLEVFLATLLPSLLGKADVCVTPYYAELKKLELTGCILDNEEVKRTKAESDFLRFLKAERETIAHRIKSSLQKIDSFIEYMTKCVRILDLAIERECGLLIYIL